MYIISHASVLIQTCFNGIYIGDVCRSLPKEISIFDKVTALQNRLCTYWVHVLYAIPSHYGYTYWVMCRLCYCCWFCLQIAENFSEDLHRVASLINKVVTMCLYDIQVSELSCYLSLSLRGKPEWDPLWWDVGGCAYIRTFLYVYVLIECHFTRLPSNVRESIPKSNSCGWRHCSWTIN